MSQQSHAHLLQSRNYESCAITVALTGNGIEVDIRFFPNIVSGFAVSEQLHACPKKKKGFDIHNI